MRTIIIECKKDRDGREWFWHTVEEYENTDDMTGQPIGEPEVMAIDLSTCKTL